MSADTITPSAGTKVTPHATLVAAQGPYSLPLVLYAADTPNTHKVAALLEELGLDYEVAWLDFGTNQQKEPWFLEINPNGRLPALLDRSDPEKLFTIFESGAILMYLARKFRDAGGSAVLPVDERLYSQVEQWVYWQVGGLGPTTGQAMYFKRIASPMIEDQSTIQFSIDRYEAEALRLMQMIDRHLEGREYIVGDTFTLADIACFGYAACHWWTGISEQVKAMPNLSAWLSRVGARPSIENSWKVPGIPAMAGAVVFKELLDSDEWQRKLVENAARHGRPHFGWRDFGEVAGKEKESTLFAPAPGHQAART